MSSSAGNTFALKSTILVAMTGLEVGDILEDRYRIDRAIARGGTSTVYRCIDLRLGRAVAAKVMDERYADDPVFLQRFKREARAMARLQHPNLVAVHDFSADGEPIYLIMELITGGTLRELLAERGPMPAHGAVAVMHSLLTGLQEVHDAGFVHRDIKPDNVLITANHRIKLGDFGLVRSSNAHQLTSGQIVGTVSYLSPEQVTGEAITPASDVYSAGIVLYELLTGTVPFRGDTPLLHATARLQGVVSPPSARATYEVPTLVDALVATATARDPHERFSDAGEFLAAVDDVARELSFPPFTVPVPKNSAAARTAAAPTSFSVSGNTGIFDATTNIPAPTKPPAVGPHEPESLSPSPDLTRDFSQRAPLGFETRLDMPQAPAAIPPALPSATPVPNVPVASPERVSPRPVGSASTALATEEEPPERPLSNRGPLALLAFFIVVALGAGAVAIGAWWFGSGSYGEIPVLWRLY